ncbi:hypothetical protein ABZ214_40130 [Streptomyces iakyrus]|uniref:hypothetical protein n=1 Tax=Streptomyces iakyrus TaxID=68219 RepID=UPI0033BA0C06
MYGHEQERSDERGKHQPPCRSGLCLVLATLLLRALQALVVLAAQSGKTGLDLADALIYGTLVRPVYVLGHYLVEARGELGEVATQVLTQL